MKTRSILIGAYEIKRHYQRYLVLGFGISNLLMFAIATSIILFIHPDLQIVCGPPRYWPKPFMPERYRDPTEHPGFAATKPIGGIPIPVPDIDAGSENDIPTQIDLAGLALETPITDLGGGVFIDTQKIFEAAFPPVDSFIPVDEQPVQVTMVQPGYPELARRSGIEHKVIVKALIDKDGSVKSAVVQNPVENDIGFEAAAIEAALQSSWKPAINNGLPVAVWVTYVVAFRLK